MRKVFLVIAVGAFTLVGAPRVHAVALKLAEVHNPAPSAGDAFGTSVATLADIDGDGAADLVVGAPGVGLVRVFSGATRDLVRTIADPHAASGTSCAPTTSKPSPCQFGRAVANLGDLNSDGLDDIGVGAPGISGAVPLPCGSDACGSNPAFGRAMVFSGANGALLRAFTPAAEVAQFGFSLERLGDVTGDNVPDVAVSAPTLASPFGQVLAFSGSDGIQLWVTAEPEAKQTIGSFGAFLASVGDVTGDGQDDVLAGAPYHDPAPSGGELVGAAYVLNGATGAIARTHANPTPTNGDFYGGGVSRIGDQDGDGRDDYVIGERGQPGTTGKLHLHSGASGASLGSSPGPADESNVGYFALAGAGDADGDGDGDLWVGAPRSAKVFLLSGQGSVLGAASDPSPTSDPTGFGAAVARLGAGGAVVGDPAESAGAGTAYVLLPNRAPSLSIANPSVVVQEGQTATNTGTTSDPDGDGVTLSASVGAISGPDAAGAWSWSLPTSDGPVESQTVTITADDGAGGTTKATIALTVENVAPSVMAPEVFPDGAVKVGTPVSAVAAFSDPGVLDTHTALVDWGDGTTEAGAIASGTVTATHSYVAAGFYTVTVTVVDDDGAQGTASAAEAVVVYDPHAGWLSAGGWFASPPGASSSHPSSTGPASFGLTVRYQREATRPTGSVEMTIVASDLHAKSTSLEWLVVTAEPRARVRGTAVASGALCTFELDAWDGSFKGQDAIGFRLFDCDGQPSVLYHSSPQVLTSGSVKLHR